jgi:polar amino acid transport system substrate-binding protein
MSPRRNLSRIPLLFLVLALAAVLAFAACKDDKKEAGKTPSASPTPAAIDISGVPELADGEMFIGSDMTYPPIESLEEGTDNPVGLDIDLAKAVAELLGVEVSFQQVADFVGIVGDLKVKRYDVVWSAITINPERSAEIDLIAYFEAGTGILVQAGNPKGIQSIEDLCGLKAAAQTGTVQIDQMKAANEGACAQNNIDIRTFPDNPAAVAELSLGRVDANLADDPVVANSALESEGDLEVAGGAIESAPYGIGVRKDSPELKAVLEEALDQLVADGTYAQVLADWQLEAGSIFE